MWYGRKKVPKTSSIYSVDGGLGAATKNEALLLGNDFRKEGPQLLLWKGKSEEKVEESGGGKDRCPGRAGKVDTGGNGEELQRRKCQEKGSAGLPGRVVTHLYASLHKPYGHSPHFRTQT